MMTQYLKIKEEYKDSLLFYRMGDFYELFFEDAVIASQSLNITLTKRGKTDNVDIPMCGVPVRSYDVYLSRLIKAGHKVAICEQIESPAEAKKRGPKSVVKREVVRLVTPGTITEDELLDGKSNNYLASVYSLKKNDVMGVSWLDISTGAFYTKVDTIHNLYAELIRINPSEILINESFIQKEDLYEIFAEYNNKLSVFPDVRFGLNTNKEKISDFFELSSSENISNYANEEISTIGTLIDYVQTTQKVTSINLNMPIKIGDTNFLQIDGATRKSLEMVSTLKGAKKGSLLSVIDYTITNAGGRTLHEFLSNPLNNLGQINQRLTLIELFHANPNICNTIREILKNINDIERALSRLLVRRGTPKDLAILRDSLNVALNIKRELFSDIAELKNLLLGIYDHSELTDKLEKALEIQLPNNMRDGGFIAKGFSVELDELINLKQQSSNLMEDMQEQLINETKASNLKINFNNILGYFIEVPQRQADKLASNQRFIHKQTMTNTVRFTTLELNELQGKILTAKERSIALELQIFEELVNEIIANTTEITNTAKTIGLIDVYSSLSYLAYENSWIKPILTNDLDFDIKDACHPVVQQSLKLQNKDFIANDCNLEQTQSLWLLTGPNMAGKSTFLRQNAIIVILAQMGSFVPASYAKIGLVDKLFSRVGASDDLARGQSTFMVEMLETASIVNQASSQSLVILDEIGRGTATYDGLSLAWAIVEHLHNVNKCRGLFATHYHELTSLTTSLKNLSSYTIQVKEWKSKIIFMHKVISGVANGSYGIHVAKLAGIPKIIIKRAKEVLKTIETSNEADNIKRLIEELPLFSELISESSQSSRQSSSIQNDTSMDDDDLAYDHLMPEISEEDQKKLDKISSINPNNLSPIEALNILYDLCDN